MYHLFGSLFYVLLLISKFNGDIVQLLSLTISTVLKTATYLTFCYIKLKNAKQKKEIITEKVKPLLLQNKIPIRQNLKIEV